MKRPIHNLCYVADDDPAIRRIICRVLEKLSFVYREFADARSLVEACHEDPPEILFLDVRLEGSDAIEAIRGLSPSGFMGRLHLVSGRSPHLLEALAEVGRRQGLNVGEPLRKPFRRAAVQELLESYRGSSLESSWSAERREPPLFAKPSRITSLAEAIRNDWVELWYQPKADVRNGLIVGAEALARVRHPEFGVLSPHQFLSGADAESLDCLAEMNVCSALRRSAELLSAGSTLRLALNMSASSLARLPIAHLVRELRPSDANWPGLLIEISEEDLVHNHDAIHEVATHLQIYGVGLALDDFGTGYSSFSRLKEFPFEEIKLDISFVQGCADQPINARICRSIIQMARSFGAVTVAEGVERVEDLLALREMGCDQIQGYVLSPAVPWESLMMLVQAPPAYLAKLDSEWSKREEQALSFPGSERLTERERQVLALFVRGCSNKAIGQELKLSPRTVETYRTRIMTKVGVHSSHELLSLILKGSSYGAYTS